MGDLAGWSEPRHYLELEEIRDRKIQEVRDFGGDPQPLIDESLFSVAYDYRRFGKMVNVVHNDHLKNLIDGPVVFENAQGVLLDENHGSAPFNTWTDTTFKNADRLLRGTGLDSFRIGIVRTYFTRHGAGPFVTESDSVNHPEPHNGNHGWQGAFRQGHFDAPAVRYAIKCCGGIDALAVTHCDRLEDGKFIWSEVRGGGLEPKDVFAYDPQFSISRQPISKLLPEVLDVGVGWMSSGPTPEHKECIGTLKKYEVA
jgi:adenylosuccinate synthase